MGRGKFGGVLFDAKARRGASEMAWVGQIPSFHFSRLTFHEEEAHVAQLVEHVLGKDEVTRSIRVVGSMQSVFDLARLRVERDGTQLSSDLGKGVSYGEGEV